MSKMKSFINSWSSLDLKRSIKEQELYNVLIAQIKILLFCFRKDVFIKILGRVFASFCNIKGLTIKQVSFGSRKMGNNAKIDQ